MISEEDHPITPQQKRIWQLQQEHGAFRALAVLLIEGELSHDVLKKSWLCLMDSHGALRTRLVLPPLGKTLVQQIGGQSEFVWKETGLDGAKAEIVLAKLLEEEKALPAEDQTPRASLVNLEPGKHALVINLPAFLCDAWSLDRIHVDLAGIYAQMSRGEEPAVAPAQYRHYSAWLQELVEDAEEGTAFWNRAYEQADLGPRTARKMAQTFSVARQRVIDSEILAAFRSQSSIESLENYLIACWQLALLRISGRSQLTLAVAYHGRSFEELEPVIGMFTRFLPANPRWDDSLTVAETVERVAQYRADAEQWQDYYELQESYLEHTLTHAFEFETIAAPIKTAGVSFRLSDRYHWQEPFLIKLNPALDEDRLVLDFYYDSCQLSQETVARWASCFLNLARAGMRQPRMRAGRLAMLGDEERRQVLIEFNDNGVAVASMGICDSFEAQAAAHPERDAVVYPCPAVAGGLQRMKYAALDKRANQLARFLRAHGVGPEVVVPICFERCGDLIVAILGVLKAGASYLPLEPRLPKARLVAMIAETGARQILVEQSTAPTFEQMDLDVFCLDGDRDRLSSYPETRPSGERLPHQAAYTLFTSGSTGKPKAVVVTHDNLSSYLGGLEDRLKLSQYTHFAHVSTAAADLGNTVLYASLCLGGTLHLISQELAANPDGFARYFHQHQIDCLKITPSHLAALLQAEEAKTVLPRGCLLLGGEATSRDLLEKITALGPDLEIVNHYGPTETTVGVLANVFSGNLDAFPIGKPLGNNRVFLLNKELEPVPVGTPGRLFISGANVTRGYFGRPALTAPRFIPNPFSAEHGARMYDSGDLARHIANGDIEFLGRADRQVKIRGYRVEPGEIEAVLNACPGLSKAVVLAPELDFLQGEKGLVAYVVPARADYREEEHLAELHTSLPNYMIPIAFIKLDRLPLTQNGKLDRQSLAALPVAPRQSKTTVAAADPLEEVLTVIWGEVLNSERIGTTDNFLELGGHSLLLISLITRIRRIFRVELEIADVFDHLTIKAFAGVITEKGSARAMKIAERLTRLMAMERSQKIKTLGDKGLEVPTEDNLGRISKLDLRLLDDMLEEGAYVDGMRIRPRPDLEERPLSSDQQRLWLFEQLLGGSNVYNNPRVVRFRGPLKADVLEKCFSRIEERHESLRTTFRTVEGRPEQEIHPARARPLALINLSEYGAEEAETRLKKRVAEESKRFFDLEKGPIWRTTLIKLGQEDHVLCLTMHHICSDAWSMDIFLDEVVKLYSYFESGGVFPLKPLPIQYADYAYWQQQRLQGEAYQAQINFWKDYLRGAYFEQVLPNDKPRPEVQTYNGALHQLVFPEEIARGLEAISSQESATLFMTLLTAFYILLYRESGREDLLVGTDLGNRNSEETEPLIGFFINQLVLRVTLAGNPTLRELLDRVKAKTLEAYTHGEVPFDQIVKAVEVKRDLSFSSLFQAKFLLQHVPPLNGDPDQGLRMEYLESEVVSARMDLVVAFWRHERGLRGCFNYNADLFEASSVKRWAAVLQEILETMVAEPELQLAEFIKRLADKERVRISLAQKESLKSFKKFKKKKKRAPREDLVRESGLAPGQSLPLVIQPASTALEPLDWINHNRAMLEEKLYQHGAILFRGFAADSVATFQQYAKALIKEIHTRNGEHKPISGDGGVQVPVDYASDLHLLWHNENSFDHSWPSKILFACAIPARQGGETPIVDSRSMYHRLKPEIRDRFAEKGILYVRNYSNHMGLSWQKVFGTESRQEVEARCRQSGMKFRWRDDGQLNTRSLRPAVEQHPVTGEWSWINQAQHWHFSCLDPETRASIAAINEEEDYPRNCYYGDGSPIDDADMNEILALYRQLEVTFQWRQGDMIWVDNLLTAHARNPYLGERKILVSMGDMRSFKEFSSTKGRS